MKKTNKKLSKKQAVVRFVVGISLILLGIITGVLYFCKVLPNDNQVFWAIAVPGICLALLIVGFDVSRIDRLILAWFEEKGWL